MDIEREGMEIGAIASMTAAEVRDELLKLGLQSIEHLPPELSCLVAVGQCRSGVTLKAVKGREEAQHFMTITPTKGTAQKNPKRGVILAALRLQFRWIQSAWRTQAFTVAAVVSVVALSVVVGFAFGMKTVSARFAKPAVEPIFDRITIINFSPAEENKIREAMRPKFTARCGEAFGKSGLRSPLEVVANEGVVIRPPSDLWLYPADSLGLVSDKTVLAYRKVFSSGTAQAGTVPATIHGVRLTTDGRPRIFLHGTAFWGKSFLFARPSLSDILTHEFIHVGGQPPTPGWMGMLQHDLAGFEPYDEIIEACR
jgi:hypothetical protein